MERRRVKKKKKKNPKNKKPPPQQLTLPRGKWDSIYYCWLVKAVENEVNLKQKIPFVPLLGSAPSSS